MELESKTPFKIELFGQRRIVWIRSGHIVIFVRQSHWKPFSDALVSRIDSVTRMEFRSPEDKVRWNELTIYSKGLKIPEDVQTFFDSPQKEKTKNMARKNKKPETVTKLEWEDFNLPTDAQNKEVLPKTGQPKKKQQLFRKPVQSKCIGNRTTS